MEEFKLDDRGYIELNSLLKVTGMIDSGGLAKSLIADGHVTVNGEVELRKRCKIYTDTIVEFDGQKVHVV
ncbi:RNA-binding S4 domain-containing protein [Leucothrix mucor]|jgi:ribosome-associated protein|uniref:RNA-binding S4 domain-containing protein n=1 Tax=Leucothrix mucor TaxID=45248 RepID=UPI0003B6D20E|nr:RNA-binding S4 domain-containing protein [Leucothrix mucor]